MKKLMLLLSLVLAIGLLAGCAQDNEHAEGSEHGHEDEHAEEVGEGQDDSEQGTEEEPAPEKNEEASNVIEIIGYDIGYEKDQVTIPQGEKVKVVFKNEGKVFHDWVIKEMPVEVLAQSSGGEHGHNDGHGDESDGHSLEGDGGALHLNAEPGEQASVEFVVKNSGKYKYDCTVPGHKEAGMLGDLIVSGS